ncbi:MAG: type II toxin-antitoxin system VapC family toxin [Ilumatobacteraceae bacterium]
MTVVLDASALLALHVDSPSRPVVLAAMESDTRWCACALALPEAVAAASRLTDEPVLAAAIEDSVRRTWDFLHVVPADRSLLDDAAALVAQQPVGVSAALHLVAASRLPRPVRFVTFDSAQIPVALSLGLDVVSG